MAAFKRLVTKLAAWALVLLALVTAAWLLVALKFVYSTGERAGYVQKFSRKGWLVKTWEGELVMMNLPGQLPEYFRFTVRAPEVAAEVNRTMGGRVVLTFNEHRFLPGQLFGETPYWVVKVATDTKENEAPASSAAPAANPPDGSI